MQDTASPRFRPRLLPTAAMLCLLALFVYLGWWQFSKGQRRAAELAQHQARSQLGPTRIGADLLDPDAVLDAPVRVRGQFEATGQFFVDNRQYRDQPGLFVVTPLRIEGSQTRILVNRGWVGWGASRQVLPLVAVPQGAVEVTGLAALPSQKAFWLMPERAEAFAQLWPRLDLKRYAGAANHPVQPLVLLQRSQQPAESGPLLVRDWPAPPDRVAMHHGYALQWAGMALALLVFWAVASTRRPSR